MSCKTELSKINLVLSCLVSDANFTTTFLQCFCKTISSSTRKVYQLLFGLSMDRSKVLHTIKLVVRESTLILTFVLASLLEGSLVPTWKIIANNRPAPVKIRVIIYRNETKQYVISLQE